MSTYTEVPPQDPSTDGDRPLLQRVFGHGELDRHDDQDRVADTVEGRTVDQALPEDQPYAGDQSADQQSADQQSADQQSADQQSADDQPLDAAARHDADQPRDAVTDEVPQGELRVDEPSGIHPDDSTDATYPADEPATGDESAHHDPFVSEPADDEAAGALPVGEPASLGEPAAARKPGDASVAPAASFWAEGSMQDLRDRWREAQLRFVDDPREAAGDTRNLVNEAVEALTAALASHRDQLSSLPTDGDTEQYRVVVQRYRTFFERLLTF